MSGAGPSVRIETVAAISIHRADPYEWRFAKDQADAIEAHWQRRRADNPRLFNGRVVLMQKVEIDRAGSLAGSCFTTDYKSFLAWREFGFPDSRVTNVFAMAALRSADGGFLLGEMGAATANAGRIYFPAGTPEPDDLKNGRVDFEGNVLRELREETGLHPDRSDEGLVRLDPGWSVVFHGAYVACMKMVRSPLSAAALIARTDAFLAEEKEPELARLKPVFSPADFDEAHMPEFMRAYMQHVWRMEG